MKTFLLRPDAGSYSVKPVDDVIAIPTLGGPPRRRRDILNGTMTFGCQFTLTPKTYDYMMEFYRNFIAKPEWFNMLLISDFANPLSPNVNHYAAFIPDTVQLGSVSGHRYSVSAAIEAFIPD